MRFGLDVAQHQLTWPELLARVQFAEQAGFDGVWGFDHFKALYGDPTGPCFEAWTVLAALAASTQRIRLGTLVTGVTYRHPSVLAAEAVTVDHVSGGRLELAIGAAWYGQEHIELGIRFPPARERAERLEEAVTVMRALMTRDHATFEGRHYQLRDATYRPRPVQTPHPPIWVGAAGERLMLPIVGRQADVWHAFGGAEDLRRKSMIVDEAARATGRDPSSIARSSSLSLEDSWDVVRKKADDFRQAGFSYLVVGWPSQGQERVEEFATQIMPEVQ
jgi:F420-dependent oxidoreductase-like protein